MDITDIRLGNYKELKKRFRKMEDDQGIPELGELNRFGDFIGVSSRYLSHINNGRKNIGHALARKMEDAFKLTHGWMDVDHLAGFVHMDSRAREFGALAMRLYMKDPEGIRSLLMRYMEDQMFSEGAKPTVKTRGSKAAK